MNTNEIKSLSEQTRNDGARLFGVSEFIYTCAIIFGWIMGIIGGILSLVIIFQANFLAGMGIALLTAIFCFINYIIAVLTTHVAKVLVHTSYSNIGILELLNKENSNNTKENYVKPEYSNSTNSKPIYQPQQSSNNPSTFTVKNKLIDLGYIINESTTSEGKTKYEVRKGTSIVYFYSDEEFVNYAKSLL